MTFAQQPADAAEISRDLLYSPARRIEAKNGTIIFHAEKFDFRFDPASKQWQISRAENAAGLTDASSVRKYSSERIPVALEFSARVDESAALLEIRQAGEPPATLNVPLWTREQLARVWHASPQEISAVAEESNTTKYEMSEPEVAAVAENGANVWLAIRFYAGEGNIGIGSLVRVGWSPLSAEVLQPAEIAKFSVTHLAVDKAAKALWLGTLSVNEGTVESAAGLVRFDPGAGSVRSYLPENSKMIGRVVTALSFVGDSLWVATDDGFCRVTSPGEDMVCWRIVPAVTLAAPAPVSHRPGGSAHGKLPAGSYEVRWANSAFLEVVTPDSTQGWVDMEDFKEYERRRFEADAYQLGNATGGGAGIMRLVSEPEGDQLSAAQVYRAALEKVGEATAEGWQQVRAHVGWILRERLEVVPVVQPVPR